MFLGLGLSLSQLRAPVAAGFVGPGPELVPNGDFSSSTGHTLLHTTISGGQGHADGNWSNAKDTVTALSMIVPGTYRVTLDIINNFTGSNISVMVAGASAILEGSANAGSYSADIVVGSVVDQTLVLFPADTQVDYDNWSVKRIA